MLAGSQIEILRDTEKYLTERVVEGTRAVHPSESRASRRPGRAIGCGARNTWFLRRNVGVPDTPVHTCFDKVPGDHAPGINSNGRTAW